jgi:hypothetical protein
VMGTKGAGISDGNGGEQVTSWCDDQGAVCMGTVDIKHQEHARMYGMIP